MNLERRNLCPWEHNIVAAQERIAVLEEEGNKLRTDLKDIHIMLVSCEAENKRLKGAFNTLGPGTYRDDPQAEAALDAVAQIAALEAERDEATKHLDLSREVSQGFELEVERLQRGQAISDALRAEVNTLEQALLPVETDDVHRLIEIVRILLSREGD